jgi:hypothetical protein
MQSFICCSFLLLLVRPTSIHAKVVTGQIKAINSWLFLDRFVFHGNDDKPAKAQFRFKFPVRSRISLLVYFNSNEDATFSKNPSETSKTESSSVSGIESGSKWNGSSDGGNGVKPINPFDSKKIMQDLTNRDVSLWKDVYSSDQTCMWRDKQSRRWGNSFDLYKIWQYSSETGNGIPNDNDPEDSLRLGWIRRSTFTSNQNVTGEWRYAAITLTVDSNNPKWFYFVVSNCLPYKDIKRRELATGISEDPQYDVVGDNLACSLSGETFCQGPLDKIWYDATFKNGDSQVSYHEHWIVFVRTVMLWIYLFVTIIVFSHVIRLSKLKKLHHTVKILLSSVLMSFLGHILGLSYWNIIVSGENLSRDKIGMNQAIIIQWPDTINIAASFFDLIAHVLLLLLLILIAKGWTITRRKISGMGRVRLATYTTIYTSVNVSAMGWSIWGFDPALVTFLHESPPGIMVQIARIVSAFWFLYACWTTIRSNPQNRRFYSVFTSVFFVWILIVPIYALGLSYSVAITYRGEVMFLVEQINMLVGHVLLTMLWSPSKFDSIFPFYENKIHRKKRNQQQQQRDGSSGNGSISSTSNNNTSRLSVSNNMEDDLSENEKALFLASSLRYRLMQLQDKTDDLVEAITTLNEDIEVDVIKTMAAESAHSVAVRSSARSSGVPDGSWTNEVKAQRNEPQGGENIGNDGSPLSRSSRFRSGDGRDGRGSGTNTAASTLHGRIVPAANVEGHIVMSSNFNIPKPSGSPGSNARRRVLEMTRRN